MDGRRYKRGKENKKRKKKKERNRNTSRGGQEKDLESETITEGNAKLEKTHIHNKFINTPTNSGENTKKTNSQTHIIKFTNTQEKTHTNRPTNASKRILTNATTQTHTQYISISPHKKTSGTLFTFSFTHTPVCKHHTTSQRKS